MIIHKGVALGNDYLVVEQDDLAWPITPVRCAAICDRHTGIGSDGLLIGAPGVDSFRLRILNPDGTEAEKSGNGLRIFGAYLHGRGLVRNEWFTVTLVRDRVRMRVEEVLADGALLIRVEMGHASFRGEEVGFTPVAGEALNVALELPGDVGNATVNTVSLSNPHCVVFVDVLDRADFLRRAPRLCTHAAFRAGTNVQFARVVDEHSLEIWIWERGVGETLASGSSACAATAAAVRRGFLRPGNFEVRMPGGVAEVEVSDSYAVRLRGPARIVFSAEVHPEQLRAWGRLGGIGGA
jgi:diaminopimelate epimerase